MNTDELAAEIRSAFFSEAPDQTYSIHQAQLTAEYRGGDERALLDARLLDREKNWWEVPDPSLVQCRSALRFLEPQGWRFYLPAYMTCAVRMVDLPLQSEAETWLPLAVVQTLSAFDEPEGMRRYMALTDSQRRVICSFLCHLANHSSPLAPGEEAIGALVHWVRMSENA